MAVSKDYFSSIGSEVVVKDAPKFDLDLYIQNYGGRTKFDRIFLIGRCSVPLCIDALKAAIAEAKRGKDVGRYRAAWECLRAASPTEPEAQFDNRWYDSVEMANKAERTRLEAELKGYKNNLVKESIRMGHEDLGRHLEITGDLVGAGDAYSKMRPEVSTAKHIIEVGRHLVSVFLQRRDWAMVITNLNKISGIQSPEEEKNIQPYMKVINGIALLGQDRYAEAALSLLQTDYQVGSASYADVMTPNDVATYGGLLALATMDRKDLQLKVLDSKFRTFLELEPHVRRAITQFVSGRYSACLSILESYKPDYLLDLYLQRHIPTIYAKIRSKCIVQYLMPFSCVTLESMSSAFNTTTEAMEEELVGMIRAKSLQARINTIDQLVTTVKEDPRRKMQAAALETASRYEREALERIRRLSIIAADLEVRGGKKLPGSSLVGGLGDREYEDLALA